MENKKQETTTPIKFVGPNQTGIEWLMDKLGPGLVARKSSFTNCFIFIMAAAVLSSLFFIFTRSGKSAPQYSSNAWPFNFQWYDTVTLFEKSIFSENGEDGILAYIFMNLPKKTSNSFLEIAEKSYKFSNVQYLMKKGWKGCSLKQLNSDLKTEENVLSLLGRCENLPKDGKVDVLSLHLHGYDFWILKSLLSKGKILPSVIVQEVNSHWDPITHNKTVAWNQPESQFKKGDFYGANLGAFVNLLKAHNYKLVYCERSGAHCFFVNENILPIDARTGGRLEINSLIENHFKPANIGKVGKRLVAAGTNSLGDDVVVLDKNSNAIPIDE